MCLFSFRVITHCIKELQLLLQTWRTVATPKDPTPSSTTVTCLSDGHITSLGITSHFPPIIDVRILALMRRQTCQSCDCANRQKCAWDMHLWQWSELLIQQNKSPEIIIINSISNEYKEIGARYWNKLKVYFVGNIFLCWCLIK